MSRHRTAIQASIESAQPRLSACIRLTFGSTSAPQPPAKHYTLETIILEAEEATANMTTEVKDISAIVHVCRLSQMRGAGYTDLQIAAAPRYDGLLETNEECDTLVKTFNGNFELLKRALEISSKSSNASSSIFMEYAVLRRDRRFICSNESKKRTLCVDASSRQSDLSQKPKL